MSNADRERYQELIKNTSDLLERAFYEERLAHLEEAKKEIKETIERTIAIMRSGIENEETLISKIEEIRNNPSKYNIKPSEIGSKIIALKKRTENNIDWLKQMIKEDQEMGSLGFDIDIQKEFFDRYNKLLERIACTSNVVSLSERRQTK